MSMFILEKKYELQMPSSYVDVNENEMEYVEGGWALNVMSNRAFGAAINTAIGLSIGGAGLAAVTSYIRRVGINAAKVIFTRTIATRLKAIGCGALAALVGIAVNFALNYLDIGNAVARFIDRRDARPNNGWLTIGW